MWTHWKGTNKENNSKSFGNTNSSMKDAFEQTTMGVVDLVSSQPLSTHICLLEGKRLAGLSVILVFKGACCL